MRRRPGGAIGAAPSNGSPEACASRWRTVEPGGPAGSSRSTTPSSAATSVASAATGFETEASVDGAPGVAARRDRRVRAGHAGRRERDVPGVDLAQSLHAARYYPGDGAPPDLGALAVRGGGRILPGGRRRARRVHVAGTAPIPPDGSPTPEGAYEQARLCLEIIAEALERAGSSLADVVRTRMFVTDPAHWTEVARAHGEAFGGRAAGRDLRRHVAARPVLEGRDRGGRGARE